MIGTGNYTSSRVHCPYASQLDNFPTAENLHADRYSVRDGSGIRSQVEAHARLYPNDPDVAAYLQIPDDAFADARIGAGYGIVVVTLADLHHSLTSTEPVLRMVQRGVTLFARAELSAVARLIQRPDGEDENAFTIMVLGMLNHLPRLQVTRWYQDETRLAREPVDWARIIRRHGELNVKIAIGGSTYDVREKGDKLVLDVLGAVGGGDDPARRKKLAGNRLIQFLAGGAALDERQMPYGFVLAKNASGANAHDDLRNLIPVADLSQAEALRVVHTMHADGDSYPKIASVLAELEAQGKIARRAGTAYLRTYADCLDDAQTATDAAVSVFQAARNTSLPAPTAPTEATIQDYLDGGDPAELFTDMQRLVICRVELLRTGVFFRALVNDIRGRDVELAGLRAIPRHDGDEFGYFTVSAPWPTPVDENGDPVPAFGIDDDVLRRSAARLLRSLRRGTRTRTGGAAHKGKGDRRVLQGFAGWANEKRHVEGNFIARRNKSNGGANVVLFERPSSPLGLGKGWSKEIKAPSQYARATVRLRVLCADLADRIEAAVEDTLPGERETRIGRVLERVRAEDAPEAEIAMLLERAKQHDHDAEQARIEAAGARKLAARVAAHDEMDAADEYMRDANSRSQEAANHAAHAQRLRDRAEAVRSVPKRELVDEFADMSATAFLVAGLRRASRNNGFGPDALGRLADDMLTDWHAQPISTTIGNWVQYAVTAKVPLEAGGHLLLHIQGEVTDIRKIANGQHSRGVSPRRGAAARLVFAHGLSVDAAVERDERDRKHLLTGSLMPWLVEHGVTSRGAKCAAVDHPIPYVRQILYAALRDHDLGPSVRYGARYCQHIVETYSDPALRWGDAACPDDTTTIAQVLATLLQPGLSATGLDVREIARLTGKSIAAVRSWAMPQDRAAGFTRPRYLERLGRQRLVPLACPHADCSGTADTVVLLPEVAASGYGLLCSTCRRAPSTEGAWSHIVFPPEYLTRFTTTAQKKLRDGARTTHAPQPIPFHVSASALGAGCRPDRA